MGQVTVKRWKALADNARHGGGLVGVDERAYPRDFAVFARYHKAPQRIITARYSLPDPLTFDELEAFLERAGERYGVRLVG
ncbi:MAG TPA: hypothetical protein VFL97_11080 [Nitrococcus sp.]|nr:hypothetical protein [Nitrococcus sp.]